MSLKRMVIPSPNFSKRGASTVRLIVLHTAEGAGTIEALGNFFKNDRARVSSHAGIDDKPGIIGEYVQRQFKAWTQSNANPYSVSAELCAFAKWSPAEWDQHPQMLANTAAWIAEEARAFSIPIVKLTPAQARGGAKGVCPARGLRGGRRWALGLRPWVSDRPSHRNGEWGHGSHTTTIAACTSETVSSTARGLSSPVPRPGSDRRYVGARCPAMAAADEEAGLEHRGGRRYGPQSVDVCRKFQQEKGLAVDGLVGLQTWARGMDLSRTSAQLSVAVRRVRAAAVRHCASVSARKGPEKEGWAEAGFQMRIRRIAGRNRDDPVRRGAGAVRSTQLDGAAHRCQRHLPSAPWSTTKRHRWRESFQVWGGAGNRGYCYASLSNNDPQPPKSRTETGG